MPALQQSPVMADATASAQFPKETSAETVTVARTDVEDVCSTAGDPLSTVSELPPSPAAQAIDQSPPSDEGHVDDLATSPRKEEFFKSMEVKYYAISKRRTNPEVAGLRTTKQQRKIRHERSSHPEQVSTTRVPVAETSTENGSGATNKSKGRSGSQRCTNSSSQGVAAKETNDKPPQHQQQNQHASGQSKRYEAMHLFRALSPRARDKQRVRDAEEQNSSSHCFEAEEAVRPGESLRDRCRRLSNQVEIQHIEDIEDETREAQEYAPPEQSTSELPRRNSSSLRPTWPGVFLWGRQVGQATFPKAEP